MIWYWVGPRAIPTLCNDIRVVFKVKHIFRSLLDPVTDTDDNLELNPNNIVTTTEAPDNSDTKEEAAAPRLATEEDVDEAEAAIVATIEAVENDVIEPTVPKFGVGENVEIEEVDVGPGGWFYYSKPGSSPPYHTVQTFPSWKSVYRQVPWLYPRRWPVSPLMTNEVGEENTRYNTKLSPSYPFYAFRKISH